MRRPSHNPFLCLACLALAALLGSLPWLPGGMAHGQGTSPTFRVGTHALRRILHDSKFRPLADWNEVTQDPGRTVLVLLGKVDLERIPGGLQDFLAEGGAVLIATDQRLVSRELRAVSGCFVIGGQVVAWPSWENPRRDPGTVDIQESEVYRGFQGGLRECILVQPELDEGAARLFPMLPLLRNAKEAARFKVATNRPSFLIAPLVPVGRLRTLATLPPGCYFETPRRSQRLAREPFAVGGDVENGRLLLLADHSVFINEMMLQEDNANIDLAYNTVEWLKDGRRDRVLFVEDGTINTKLDVPVREVKLPLRKIQMAAVEAGNRTLMKLQERHQHSNQANESAIDVINRASGRVLFSRAWEQNYYLLFGVLVAFALLGWGVMRLRRASFRPEPFVPLLATAIARHAPPTSVLNQRSRHAVREDHLGDHAHILAQEWLISTCSGNPSGRPRVIAQGNWWRRWTLRSLVLRLWRLAQAEVPQRMSQREFRRLLAHLETLRDALAAGELRLE